MKQLVFAILAGFLVVLTAQSGFAQADVAGLAAGAPGTSVMNASQKVLPLIALNDAELFAGSAGPYRPDREYRGGFERNRLYKKRSRPELWRENRKPAFVQRVKCTEAAQSLHTRGTWTGNVNKDGSCGSLNEPAEWATGNYLNFLMPEEE